MPPKKPQRRRTDKPITPQGTLFRRISSQLTIMVAAAVTIGLVIMVLFYSERQRNSILTNNHETMHQVTLSAINSLKAVMLAGYADIAQTYADNLKQIPGVVDFRILRRNGLEAFRDNLTIDAVNEYRGDEDFEYRDRVQKVQVLPPDDPNLQKTVAEKKIHWYYENQDDAQLTFLAPISYNKDCDNCHEDDQQLRGVLKLTTSLSAVNEDLRRTRNDSIKILLLAILAIVGVTLLVVRRSVLRPINQVSAAMAAVSTGSLHQSVPVLGRDELAEMAQSFNRMTEELNRTYSALESEQNKLATIILTASEGIVATNPELKVVLVNPAISKILEKPNEQIIEQGFLQLFDDPDLMNKWLRRADAFQQVHLITYRNKILNIEVATIRDDQGVILGTTALIRDVTREKQLEEKLRRLAVTDGLTGLHNRRFLDEAILHETERASANGQPLSLFMFDIDHFKQFNDNHGHDQGDRVLQAVAQCLRDTVRTVDLPCRYGGEEFLVILPNTPLGGATMLAERLRQNIEALTINGLRVTVSIGVANLENPTELQGGTLLESADQALYQAKAQGRNRVVVARLDAEL